MRYCTSSRPVSSPTAAGMTPAGRAGTQLGRHEISCWGSERSVEMERASSLLTAPRVRHALACYIMHWSERDRRGVRHTLPSLTPKTLRASRRQSRRPEHLAARSGTYEGIRPHWGPARTPPLALRGRAAPLGAAPGPLAVLCCARAPPPAAWLAPHAMPEPREPKSCVKAQNIFVDLNGRPSHLPNPCW